MALSRIKNFIAEILYFSDLNAEFNNILTNGAGSLSSPRTADFSLVGYKMYLDATATTYVMASTSNVIDFYGASTLLFKMDMSVATPVNALTLKASATTVATSIEARGADTNISINLVPKGTGTVQINGTAISTPDTDTSVLASQVFG